jgi:hypothetical protein
MPLESFDEPLFYYRRRGSRSQIADALVPPVDAFGVSQRCPLNLHSRDCCGRFRHSDQLGCLGCNRSVRSPDPRRPGWPSAPLGEILAAEVTPRRFLWRRHAGADGGGQRPDQNRPTSDGGSAGSRSRPIAEALGAWADEAQPKLSRNPNWLQSSVASRRFSKMR